MAETKFESYDNDGDLTAYVHGYWAQTFTASPGHNTTKVRLKLYRGTGQTGTYTVELRTTTSGHPTSTILASVGPYNLADLSTSPTWYDFAVAYGSLVAGSLYAIVIAPTVTNNTGLYWRRGGGYSGGQMWIYSGGNWLGIYPYSGYDGGFAIYGDYSIDTNAVSDIEYNQADGNATIIEASGVDEYGFEWGTVSGTYTEEATVVGTPGLTFTVPITGLEAAYVYYVRAKIHHPTHGWIYGDQVSFRTTHDTRLVEYIEQTVATGLWNFYGNGWNGQTFTPASSHWLKAVKLKLYEPGGGDGLVTVAIRKTTAGKPSGADLVLATMPGSYLTTGAAWHEFGFGDGVLLQAATLYAIVIRKTGGLAYWTRSGSSVYAVGQGTSSSNAGVSWTLWSWDFSFYEYGLPSIQTNEANNIRARQATGNGFIPDGDSIDEYGFEWGTSLGGPYGDDVTEVPVVDPDGDYSMELTSLDPDTTYYYRAKMNHSVDGWYYGNEQSFKTPLATPTVETLSPTAKAETTATLAGEVTDQGDSDVTKRGFVYGLSSHSNPGNVAPGASGYDSSTEESDGPYVNEVYTLAVTGLTANKVYYVRAYAYNTDGYRYGGELPFLTNSKVDYLFASSDYSKGIRFDSSPGGGYPHVAGGTISHYILCRGADTDYTVFGWWGYLTGNFVYEKNYYNDNYYTDLFTLTNPIIRDTAIMKVKYRANLWRSGYPFGKYKRELRTHGVTYTGAAGDISAPSPGNPCQVCEIFYTNPNTGNAWTLAELDALIAGITLGHSGGFGLAACDMVRVVALWANAEVSNDGWVEVGDDLRLNGTVVEDEAADVTVYFEWGETTAYGNVTADQTDKIKGDAFLADVTIPESGIVHFRPVIVTACGETFYGPDASYPDLPGIWLGDEDDWYQLEITDYILAARSEIGWDDELAQATAGIGEYTADNHLGYFSPDNVASPLYGFLFLGARITQREIYGGKLYPIFTGRIDRIVPHAEKDNLICYIQALDGMDDLANVEISTALFTPTDTGELAAAVLDEAAWSAVRREIDTGIDSLSLGWFHRVKGLEAFRTLEKVENGRFWVKPNGNARWENRHFRVTGDRLISQGTFDETMVELAYEYSKRLLYNEVNVTGRRYFAGGVQLFMGYDLATIDDDLVWSAHAGDTAAPYIPQASTVVVWAEFNAPLYDYTTLVKGTHWDANTEPDGTGTDVGANITIVERQFGQAVRLTITNAGSQGAYLIEPGSPPVGAPTDRTLLIYGSLYGQDNMTIIEEDTASQQTYGKRTLTLDTPFKSNPNDILAFAQYLKERHSSPIPVPVQAKFVARTGWPDDTIYIATLALHISDRVTIGSALLGISADFYINKVVQEYAFNESGFVRETTWSLEAAEGSAEGLYWLLGEAGFGELGLTTRLGF